MPGDPSDKPADAFVCGLIDASLEEFMLWMDANPGAPLDAYPWPGPRPPAVAEARENAKSQTTS